MIRDKNQQRAEISAYFQLFDEAEALFASMDRFDLSLAMRIKLGDWFKVEKMLRAGIQFKSENRARHGGFAAGTPQSN